MNKKHILAICLLSLISVSASAQFKKPLSSQRDKILSSEARLNVGVFGGGTFTTWMHINSAEASNWYLANYHPQVGLDKIGFFGGVAVEYMYGLNQSIGLNVLYAQHNMGIGYTNKHFPTGIDQYVRRDYDLEASYSAIEGYVPFTFYFPADSKRTILPYVYIAPRVSYILDGGFMSYKRTDYDIQSLDTLKFTSSSSLINDSTFKMLNVGAMLGVGSQFRISASNYYFIFKVDLSANMYGISTFTETDLQNEFNHLRYNGDAHLTVTFMLPIKKRLQGACMKWGEYD